MKAKVMVLLTSILLIPSTYATAPLFVKEGAFHKFGKCSLSEGSATIEILTGPTTKISETTLLNESLEDLVTLSDEAIRQAGREFYRWSGTQSDYLAQNSQGGLKTFYAYGFKNISNDSSEARALITRLDQICDRESFDFKILGDFELALTMNGQTLIDKISIKRRSENFGYSIIEGSYIVPNSFESKIENLNYQDDRFSFEIRVREGNEDYMAKFEGYFNDRNHFSGHATVLSTNELLGIFTGARK